MMKYIAIASALIAGVSAEGNLLNLKEVDYDKVVKESGASTFIKFFAPWCGHCKAMAPAWIELADKYAADASVNIAEIDCTVETSLCSKYGVSGYPTIKYSVEGADLEAYNGGRDLDSFSKHVADKLSKPCSYKNKEACSDKEKEYMTKFEAKGKDAVEKELERVTKMASGKMAADKKKWALQRKSILSSLKSEL